MRTTEVENMTEREIEGMQLWLYHEQTCSRLRKCSFTAFSPVENYSIISEAGNVKLPALYNEVRI